MGVVRVSVDERMIALHGRLGVDYGIEDHDALLGPVVEWAKTQILETLNIGESAANGRRSSEQTAPFRSMPWDKRTGNGLRVGPKLFSVECFRLTKCPHLQRFKWRR
jgi:hypothetical protein